MISGTEMNSSGSHNTRQNSSRRRLNDSGSSTTRSRQLLYGATETESVMGRKKSGGTGDDYEDEDVQQQREARKREREEKEKTRELKLREFLQESCYQAISALLTQLNHKLSELASNLVPS